jgi:hypothetical protein
MAPFCFHRVSASVFDSEIMTRFYSLQAERLEPGKFKENLLYIGKVGTQEQFLLSPPEEWSTVGDDKDTWWQQVPLSWT